MLKFDERALEMSIVKLLEDKGYIHISGNNIVREKTEVLLVDDLRAYLHTRYASDELTESEIDSIILSLRTVGGTLYEANKAVMSMVKVREHIGKSIG